MSTFIILVAFLVVMTLATLVAAYMGSKVWHWAHVLVVVGLFFAVVGFSFLAAKALDIRTKHMERVREANQELEPLMELAAAVSRGTDNPDLISRMSALDVRVDKGADSVTGFVDLEHQLRLANQTAGRVWPNAQPTGPPNPQTGEVAVGVENPNQRTTANPRETPLPLGIKEGGIMFVFEQGQPNTADPTQGPQYLGEFRVTAVEGQQLALEPVLPMFPQDVEMQRLLASRGPWVLYETMPGDSHEVFAQFTDDQLRQLLPASSVEEYVRDGTPWTVDDGEWVKEGRDEAGQIVGPEDWDDNTTYVYRRQLRDYAFLFNDLAKLRVELISRELAIREDTEKLKAADASAKKLGNYRLAEQRKLRSDLEGVKADRAAIEAHLAALEQQIGRGQALLQKVVASNAAMVEQLASLQRGRAGVFDLERQPVPSRGGVDIDAL